MRNSSREHLTAWGLRLGLLLLVVIAPWPFGSVTPRPAAFLSICLVALCASFLASRVYSRKLHAPPGWIWLVMICGLVLLQQLPLPSAWVQVVAPSVGGLYAPLASVADARPWHPVSAEPFQTRWAFLQLVSLIAAFYMATQLFRRRGASRHVLVYALALLGVSLSLFAVYQKTRLGTALYGRFPVPSATPYGPFVNHNHFAGFVEACALLSLGTALGTARRNPPLALLLGGASGLMGISLVLSHSRGGLIATSAGVIVLAVLSRSQENRARQWIAGGALAVALFLAAFAPASLSERLSTLRAPGQDSAVQFRLDLWSDSAGVFAESPAVGTGLGTYAAVIPGYRSGVDETRADFAESDWIQLACETGLLGLILTLAFLVVVARLGLRAIGNETASPNRGILTGALAASAALVVHGVYDFNLHIPSNALLFAILLGLLASNADVPSVKWRSRRAFPVVAVAIAACVVWYSIAAMAIGESRQLTREIDPVLTTSNEFTGSIQRVVRSRRAVKDNPETAHLLGRLYNEEAYRSPDAARYREVRLDQAAAAFREAIALAPARGRYWFELGWTEANRGNDGSADVLFKRAFELEARHSPMHANHASYLASRGRIDEALDQLARARELEPGIRSLEALNVIAPFVGNDSIALQRAAGPSEEGAAALEEYRASRLEPPDP